MTNRELALEKLAGKGELGKKLKAGYEAVKEKAGQVGEHLKANKAAYIAGAGGLAAGVAGHQAYKALKKEGSASLSDIIEKNAAGKKPAAKATEGLGVKAKAAGLAALEHLKKNKAAYIAGAGGVAAGALGSKLLAHKAEKNASDEIALELGQELMKCAAAPKGAEKTISEILKSLPQATKAKIVELHKKHPRVLYGAGAGAAGLTAGVLAGRASKGESK